MNFQKFYLKESPNRFYHGSMNKFDSFSNEKIMSGEGLNKYGFGLYFTDTLELAQYYSNGKYIYEVSLRNLNDFYKWDEETPDNIYRKVIKSLEDLGHESDAEEIKQEYEEYGDRWSIDSLYQYLEAVFKSSKEVSEFLYNCGVAGVIAKDIEDRGTIYVCFSDEDIRIVDSYKIGERNDE